MQQLLTPRSLGCLRWEEEQLEVLPHTQQHLRAIWALQLQDSGPNTPRECQCMLNRKFYRDLFI